ncbi:MAG: spore maturation protein A [Clostridia bacterium]|nr:spore maturation protein A [Clostridia bacterium]
MMNFIIAIVFALSFISAVLTDNMADLSEGVLSGAKNAVSICISLLGTMALWNGLTAVAESSGLSEKIRRLLSPLIRLIFPYYGSSPAAAAIGANITANLLGMGNAATPLGIEAMRRMKEYSGNTYADRETVRFVVLNTAAITLIPTTVSALRSSAGSKEPFSILVPVWLTGISALLAGLIAEKLLSKGWKN